MTRQDRMIHLLTQALNPIVLEIENESHKHQVPTGSETHFKLILVAPIFQQLERIERHRKINSLLADEFKTGLHALSLYLYSPTEWQNRQNQVPKSPPCHGGSHHD